MALAKSPSRRPVAARVRRAPTATAKPGVARPARAPGAPAAALAAEHARLVHELQVHQVELETQNLELREAQQLLELSRDRYADLFDFAPVGYVTLDDRGVIREINLTAAGMLGGDRVRLLDRPMAPHIAPADLAAFRAHLRALTAPDQPATVELHLTRKLRLPLPVFLQSTLVAGPAAGSRRYRTTLTDLSARVLAEAALRHQEARLRAILDTAVEGIITIDEDGTLESLNPAAAKMFGYRADEALGRKVNLLMPSPYHEEPDRYLASYRTTGERKIIGLGREVTGRRKDGTLFPLDLSVSEVQLGGRRIFTGFVRDITHRQQAEAELRASAERYRLLADHAEDFVALNDTAGNRQYVSPSFYRRTGWTPAEIQASDWRTRLHPADLPLVERTRAANLAGETTTLEHRIRCRDGSWIWVEARCKPVTDAHGKVCRMVLWSRDITERKRGEAELRLTEAELGAAQRIAFIGSWYWDARTDVTTGSDELLRIFGLDPTRQRLPAFRKQRGQLYPVASWERLQAAVQTTMQTGCGYELEVAAIRAGAPIWVTTRSEAVRNPAGEIVGLRGTVQDITARKREEQRRHLQYETARLLAAAKAPAETMAKLLQAVATTFGWEVGQFWEMTGTPAQLRAVQVWHAPGRRLDAFVKHLLKLTFSIADGLPGRVLADGRTEWIAAITRSPDFRLKREAARAGLRAALAFPILLKDQPLGVLAFLASEIAEPDEDLLRLFTSLGSQIGQFLERRKAEAALREAHEFSKQVVDGAAAGIIVYNREGRFVVWNPFMEQLTGHGAAELLGRRAVAALPFLGGVHFWKMFHDALAGAVFEAADIPFARPHAGKQGWLAARFAPWRDARHEIVGVIVTVRDITERRQLESELLEIADREQRRIGHDLHDGLGQQLTALEMKCFLLQEDLAADELAARREKLLAQTRQISQALQECITVTRSLAHGLAPSALTTEGLAGALERLALGTRVPGKLECRLVSDGPVTITNAQTATHLYRIAQEAVNNALKHARMRRIEIHLTHAREVLRLQIKDDGRGLPQRRKARPGMGLEVMRHRAHVIGASLEIASSPGRGVTVTCTLPLKQS